MFSAELHSTGEEHLGSVTGQLDVKEDTFGEEMPEEERGGPVEELEEVVVREENPPKTVKIGSTLSPEHKAVLQKVLRDYNDVFAWSHEEMPDIPPNLAAHRLNVDPTFKPVKQKRRVIVATIGTKLGISPTSKEFIAEAFDSTIGFAFGVSNRTLEFTLDVFAIISATNQNCFRVTKITTLI
ncbi:hypothetical protein EZV62_018554 [Acer yangbiense]|uniref:Uncharacterized protein n=1 Tax=Acer yangbiense TaxID=1000413 RepID=A0A5C7HJP3_9ROSI|nr:hypothetical protein EZV62_018554 [Acer yangbiense]